MKALTFAALVLAAPVAAQDRMTQDQCVQMLGGVMSMVQPEFVVPDITLNAAGWCIASDIDFLVEQGTTARLSSLEWRASDVERFLEQGLPPRSFEMVARGFGIVPQTGDPVFDYLFGLQTRQSNIEFGLNVRWDGVQNAVVLDKGYVAFDDTNRIDVTARIEGVDLTDFAAMQTSAGTAGLRDLTVQSTFDGWFEAYLLMIVGAQVLESGEVTPEEQVAALKGDAVEFIGTISDDIMIESSRTALAAFVNAMPTPRGVAQFQLTADPIVGGARGAAMAMLPTDTPLNERVNMVLDGVVMTFTWAQGRAQ